MRNAFNAAIVANCSGCPNVECCDNENVGESEKHYSPDNLLVCQFSFIFRYILRDTVA